MINNALYYPHIAFSNPSWLKSMALFYDSIYRIVPNNIIPEDNEELQPLLEDPSIGKMIDPARYSPSASNDFLNDKENWDAAAFVCNDEDEVEKVLSRLHSEKTDEKVRTLFSSLGYGNLEDEWFHIPTELASHFMLYLANDIAKKNELNLITNDWAPWTATTYYNLDGNFDDCVLLYEQNNKYSDDPFALFSLIIGEITPINIHEISGEEIISFREKRKDEITQLRETIYQLYSELQKLEDPVVRKDLIDSKINELLKAQENYKKCADIIKAKGWMGSVFLGLPAPVALGSLLNIPSASIVSLGAASLAIGGIFNLQSSKAELLELQKRTPISALVSMSKSFKGDTYRKKEVGLNYFAYDSMEEFVND
ncbi:MAG: hypothetical protein ACI8PB_004976 [Desulforhopalus sp.]|jgi:hypothetical protein